MALETPGSGPRADLAAGLCVFLLALPLSLGIAVASGCPPTAGLITAGLGSLLVAGTRPSLATIKGPAAGLVVVVLAAVTELGNGDPSLGYRRMLAAACVGGGLQLALSYSRFGALVRRVPRAVVDGMLVAIGAIIIVKQLFPLVGAPGAAGTPIDSLAHLVDLPGAMVLGAAAVGLASVLVLVGWGPLVEGRRWLAAMPAPIVAVAIAVPVAALVGLSSELRLDVPDRPWTSLVAPDFSVIASTAFWRHAVMLALVGSLESSLTVAAIAPEGAEGAIEEDLRGLGLGNAIVGLLGGLPMISEVVRSRAAAEAGATSWRAGAIHGALLLACWVALPAGLRQIPLAALAAMLVVVGSRLVACARPARRWREAPHELAAVAVTAAVTFATDLLVGVAAGWLVYTALGRARRA